MRWPKVVFPQVDGWSTVPLGFGASHEQYTSYVDDKINANVIKVGSHEVV